MLSPNRPSPIQSAVTICFAAMIGWNSGACTVPNTISRWVLDRSPVAQVIVSSVVPMSSVSPP